MTTPITIQQTAPGQPIQVSVLSVGFRGPQGDLGPANTLTIGTVTTGEAGAEASAEITGEAPNQTLNLTIPRGDVGETGETGATGEAGDAGPANTLTIGTVTTGGAGTQASVEITGAAPNQTLNLTIPRGDMGEPGDPGQSGDAGPANTLTIGTVTTGGAGTQASAEITGEAPNQTLNLTIPRGDVGETGETGATGDTGADGKEVELQASDTHVQWRYVGGSTWTNLVALSEIAGADGEDRTYLDPRVVETKTENYAIQLGDEGKFIAFDYDQSATIVITVPEDDTWPFEVGAFVDLANIDTNSNIDIEIVAESGVTLLAGLAASNPPSIGSDGGVVRLTKLSANKWILYGDVA